MENDGSDLYLSTGAPPCAKFQGKLRPLNKVTLKTGEVQDIANEIMDAEQRAEFQKELEMNLAYTFYAALFELIRAGKISEEEALKNSDSPNNLRLEIKLSNNQVAESLCESEEESNNDSKQYDEYVGSRPLNLSLEVIEEVTEEKEN